MFMAVAQYQGLYFLQRAKEFCEVNLNLLFIMIKFVHSWQI